MKSSSTIPRKVAIGEGARPLNLLRNWLHQSFFYLDVTERIAKILSELVSATIIAILISPTLGVGLSDLLLWGASLSLAHSFNWILNGNWWACVLFAFPTLRNPGEEKTREYLNAMRDRMKRTSSISGVLIFGSIARGEWHSRSDIDLRLLRKMGPLNAILSWCALFRERLIAFFLRQPLDVYLADDIDFLKKMRVDESPIFLKKEDPRLDEAYPDSKEGYITSLRGGSPEGSMKG